MKQIDCECLWPCSSCEGRWCVYNVFRNQLLQDMCFSLGSESFHSAYAVIQQRELSSKHCAGNPVWLMENFSVKCDLRPKLLRSVHKICKPLRFQKILAPSLFAQLTLLLICIELKCTEHCCPFATAVCDKFRRWTNIVINCNCLVHLAFWYNLNPFYQMQISMFLSGALNSIFDARSLSFAIHKVVC